MSIHIISSTFHPPPSLLFHTIPPATSINHPYHPHHPPSHLNYIQTTNNKILNKQLSLINPSEAILYHSDGFFPSQLTTFTTHCTTPSTHPSNPPIPTIQTTHPSTPLNPLTYLHHPTHPSIHTTHIPHITHTSTHHHLSTQTTLPPIIIDN